MNATDKDRDAGLPHDALAEELLDPRFVELLATYDELFVSGTADLLQQSPARAGDPQVVAGLEDAKECVRLLEQVWPRSGAQHVSLSKGQRVRRLGRFDVVCELGRGGGGIVFLAIDPTLDRHVALKVPYPNGLYLRDLRRRFVQEAQAAAALDHPNIISIYEAGEAGPICYIASAYCEGPTLAAWLSRSDEVVPIRTAAEIIAALADAVDHAHARGILHRDLKPSNVLLEVGQDWGTPGSGEALGRGNPGSPDVWPAGRRRESTANDGLDPPDTAPSRSAQGPGFDAHGAINFVPKLTDFGLAKVLQPDGKLTQSGCVLGTPEYMAPEQAEGRHDAVCRATDVYALGVMLYEMITGQLPHKGDTVPQTVQQIIQREPTRPSRFRSELPRDLEAICLKCLEKEPQRRYEDAAALASDLRRFLAWQLPHARLRPPGERVLRWMRRRRGWAAATALIALSLGLGASSFFWHAHALRDAQRESTTRIEALAWEDRQRSRRDAYASSVLGAYKAWKNFDIESASELLDQCLPAADEEDLRCFEWYYLRRLCNGGHPTLVVHRGRVLGASLSPDGRFVASCGDDGFIRTWDAHSGLPLRSVRVHEDAVQGIVFSPDGELVATADSAGGVRLWEATTLNMRATLAACCGRVLCVAFSPDGRRIAAGGDDHAIRVWSVDTGELELTISAHDDTINSLAFSPQGDLLASGSADATAKVWELSSPEEPALVLDPRSPVVSVAFTPDGRSLATADSFIRIWDLAGEEPTLQFNNHHSQIRGFAVSPSGTMVASGAHDMTIRTWDLTTQTMRHIYRGHVGTVTHLAFSADGDKLASCGADGTVHIWDPNMPQDRSPLPIQGTSQLRAEVSPDGTIIASTSYENGTATARVRETATGRQLAMLTTPGSHYFSCLAFSPDSTRLALATDPGPFVLWNFRDDTVQKLGDWAIKQTDCAFSDDGKYLAVAPHEFNSVRVFDAVTGSPLARAPGQRCVAFSPDTRVIAMESAEVQKMYPIELWDHVAGKSVARLAGHTKEIYTLAISPDGRLLASGSLDGTCVIWSIADGTQRHVLRGHVGAVSSVAFIGGGRRLVSAGRDGTIRFWDVETGRPVLELETDAGRYNSMCSFSRDGSVMVTLSQELDGSFHLNRWFAKELAR